MLDAANPGAESLSASPRSTLPCRFEPSTPPVLCCYCYSDYYSCNCCYYCHYSCSTYSCFTCHHYQPRAPHCQDLETSCFASWHESMFLRGEFNRWGEASEGIQASFHDLGFRADSQRDKKNGQLHGNQGNAGACGLKVARRVKGT